MINKITVSEKRGLFPEYLNLGTIGEKNATTLLFLLPSSLQGYSENIVCETAQGSFTYDVLNDTFDLPSEVLTGSTLDLQLILRDGDKVIWKSIPYTFTLNPTLDDSGINVIDTAKAEQRETDRTELAGVITDLTGEDFSAAEWDELMDVTAELPVKTEQDVLDLRKCSELTYAFAHATTPPSLITGGYKLDKEDPDVPDSPDVLIKLPFLETPNAVYTTATRVSASVEECGFSIGEASANTISSNEKSMFNEFGGNVPQNLKRLTLTGVERILDTSFLFYGCSSFEEIELIEGGKIAEKYSDKYYSRKFGKCTNLKSILGTPLDMSRGAFYDKCFMGCQNLRHVRFKPGTICHNLDLSDCSALIKKYEATTDDPGTLLSIINGVRDYTGAEDPITIKFSAFVKSYLSSWRCTIDEQTGLYVYSDKNSDFTMWSVLTNLKGVVIS